MLPLSTSSVANGSQIEPEENQPAIAPEPVSHPPNSSLFLVCGLGSLGQNCVVVLKQYGVTVNAIDTAPILDWELPELPGAIATLIFGDCRKPEILEQVEIRHCRAVLFVTDDERVNTEAAFAARLLSPNIRLIVRSSKHNLNHFLEKSLGNFIAFEPTDLSASAFAFAALGSEIPGYFKLENQLLRVVKHQVKRGDRWCNRADIHSFNTSSRRVLCHSAGELLIDQFYEWETDSILQDGDTIAYIELTDRVLSSTYSPVDRAERRTQLRDSSGNSFRKLKRLLYRVTPSNLKQQLIQYWQSTEQYRAQRVAIICGILTMLLLTIGTVLLHLEFPKVSIREALSASFSLLLGGYSDIFGGLNTDDGQSTWSAQLLGAILTLSGTAFVGVIYALLTEALLTSKFHFFKNRPPLPTQHHIIVIGLNKLGHRIVDLLEELKQPLVGITTQAIEPTELPQLPVIIGQINDALPQAHVAQAKTAIVVLDDDMENLEIGLMVHAASPLCELVLRTQDQLFSNNVARLFPYAQVLCAPAVSAEVFVAAAFGENVLSLFHLGHQAILVTEYEVCPRDTLNGFLLAEVAYGYGVVPVLHQRNANNTPNLLPSDDIRLEQSDRLIVLATSESLQRIERGELAARQWQVHVEKALTRDAVFEGANEISRISGYSLSSSRHLMASLPAHLPIPLYKHQAQRLVRHLNKVQVKANLQPMSLA